MIKNIEYLLSLHSIDGLGPIRLKALLDYYQDPKLVWEAKSSELLEVRIPKNAVQNLISTREKLDPKKYLQSIIDVGIKWITVFDKDYPKLLTEISDPPIILYYQGEINSWDARAIAVVGSRKMTSYGKLITNLFTKEFIRGGLTIVSGLARGVDTEAHKTAVEEGGKTIAVLGGGLKKIFPPENASLAQKIISGYGVIVSEFPPDAPSVPGNFPARNRIISGLSLAVVVTEAAVDSGSLITAKLAAEQGRDVYAIPGPITSTLSHGPISLIKDGAKAVYNAEEVLEDLGTKIQKKPVNIFLDLSVEEKKVWELLENESIHIDELCRKLNWVSATASALLIKMEISGLVKNLGNGIYCRL